jgi:SAM-dependent methyltransferase
MDHNAIVDMPPDKREVADLFDRVAAAYGNTGPGFFAHFGRRMVEIAGIGLGASVLDVCTGRGASLLPAAEAVGPHGSVTGIDLSPAMVWETARELARLNMPANVQVRQMDGEHLEFADESFDHVLCGFALFFFPQPAQVMSEFRRVLKPEAEVCIGLWDRLLEEQWTWMLDLVKTHLPPEIPRATDTGTGSAPVFDTAEGLIAILQDAGFEDPRVVSEAADFVYADEQEYWATLWSNGMRQYLEKIDRAQGSDGLEQFRLEVFGKLGDMKQPDGIHQVFPALIGVAAKPRG